MSNGRIFLVFLENINLLWVTDWPLITIIIFQNISSRPWWNGNKNALSKVISPHCVSFLSFVVSFSYICTFHHIRENKFYTYLIYVLFFWCTAWKMFQISSIFSSIFDKCPILLQTQSRQNHKSYRNFHFNELVANASHDNIDFAIIWFYFVWFILHPRKTRQSMKTCNLTHRFNNFYLDDEGVIIKSTRHADNFGGNFNNVLSQTPSTILQLYDFILFGSLCILEKLVKVWKHAI